jgi:hypothetical protein
LTIERKDLEFILSHFEPPAVPRRISTKKSEDRQYAVYSIDRMLADFREAEELDCKVNAYRFLGNYNNRAGAGNGNGNNDNDNGHHNTTNSHHNYEDLLNMSRELVAKQIQQRAETEAAPTLIHIDLDRKNFSTDRVYNNAVKKTIAKIHEVFLIPSSDASPVTTYWSGGGTHILLPLEVDPAKYPVKNGFTLAQTVPGRDLQYASFFTGSHDYRFMASHKLPANLFLWFAEDYLTNGKGDTGHHPSVRSSMVRVPGSYNSKYYPNNKEEGEVKILQRWDGVTKAHILFLLGAFYRNVGDDHKKQARMFAKARKVKRQALAAQMALDRTLEAIPVPGNIAAQTFGEGAYSAYAHNKYWYIDRLLQIPVDDFRKRGIDMLLTPFLITVKRMPDTTAKQIMLNWLLECDELRPLDFDPEYRIHSKIIDIRASGYLPLGEEKFKAEDPELFYRLSNNKISDEN